MKKAFKKVLIVLAVTAALVCMLVPTAFAAGGDIFTAEITPYKSEYQQGEKMSFKVKLQNDTDNYIHSVLVEAVPKDGGLYTDGMHNRDIETITAGGYQSFDLSIQERIKVVEVGATIAGVSTLLFSIYAFFIRRYYSVAAIYVIASMIFTSAFASFPTNLSRLNFARETQDLGSVCVTYDGHECEIDFKVSYEKPKAQNGSELKMLGNASESSFVEANVTFTKKDSTGIVFAADEATQNGYLFGIDISNGKAFLMKKSNGKYVSLGTKAVTVSDGQSCKMRVEYNSSRVKAYFYSNPKDNEPYPLFDLEISSFGTAYGVKSYKNGYSDVKVGEVDLSYNGETYENPVTANMPDPYVLTYNGVYYIYSTNHPNDGFEVFTSTDLVNWKSAGMCAKKGDIIGDSDFWAPEVYERNGKFYMLYTAEEFLAMAVSDSPTGPFTKTSDEFIISDCRAIDGNILFDDDGSIYLYFSKITDNDGQQLWGCRMSDDLLTIDKSTLTRLTSPEGWEGNVNEGPFVIKHNGTYYLTYSGDGYTGSTYSVGYATSDSPLGTFTKYEGNPVLSMTREIVGTGHHCFAMSPDGSEMFIIYHCHYSKNQVHSRKLCIDRVKFVPSSDGADIISVYGPTETPQPMPSK